MLGWIRWCVILLAVVTTGCDLAPDSGSGATEAIGPAPAATQSSQDRAYVQSMLANVDDAHQVLAQFTVQAAMLEDNPSLVSDDRWRLNTAGVLVRLERTGHDLQQHSPVPSELVPLNDECVALGKDLVAVATDYSTGVGEFSLARMQAAAEDRRSADARLQKVADELDALR